MDLISTQGKLAYFRIKELKDVLTKLGLPKQGKKQDLVDRISRVLPDEGLVNIINDTYRKMQISEASELANSGQTDMDLYNLKLETEVEDSITSDVRICCPCGNSYPTELMVQCVDPGCLVQQHAGCVIIPEKPMEEIPSTPPPYFCEMCRIKRADPFLLTVACLVSPMKLVFSNIPPDGTNPLQIAETTFLHTQAHKDLLQKDGYDIQAWCILLNDRVSFRMQWPQFADLQVNGHQVRAVNRQGSQLLGANGRDDGPIITFYIIDGANKISLSACDARNFCFGVRLVKRRTVEQVRNLIPKETDGELFEDALARIRRCIGGGMATGNEDSDSDLEVIAESITVSLRCPMSGSRMKVAGRFKPCAHMGCFDLQTFIELNQRSRKWQCPICLKNYTLEDIIIDPYFNRITKMMQNCDEDITDIEVKPDGSWTVKTKGELGDLAKWHLPDGSLCNARNEIISKLGTPRQIIKEGSSVHTSVVGIKQNFNGTAELSKNQLIILSPIYQMEDRVQSYEENFITMSSSASGSGRDDEDPSINQNCNGHIDNSANNGNEINFIPGSFNSTLEFKNQTSAVTNDTDIIILSDSEEDNKYLDPAGSVYKTFPEIDSGPPGFSGSYLSDSMLDAAADSCLGLFGCNISGIGIPNWPYTSVSREGSGFQLFGTDSNVSEAFVDLDHSSVMCSAPMNGFTSVSRSTLTSGREVLDSQVCHSNIDIDEHLIGNTSAYVGDDPSLQSFLPSQPPVVLSESDLGQQPLNGIHTDDWISLRLGSDGEHVCGDLGSNPQPAATNGLELRHICGPNGAASLSGETKSNRKNNKKLSDGPFSFPRQPRSVRQRVHPS
ncbi:E3 SUMO-protein ligase SIZ1-like isoform X3 [Mangifera indica]|uniref:E3 SUMO-protein ligase SIZ1-like isoform X3 n=1 Tax=Mangifera indica TaxID=29780 RepID=UPI001CF9761C|nr:E3 SUMO-protein ligase SIZ1-like isoform X3 [Mangifera indica]